LIFAQILVLLLAAVLCISNVMSHPCKKEDFPYLRQSKPTVGILRIRYFLFGDDSISQEELDLFKQEPNAGRDKVPPSGPGEQMRRPDEKAGQPILKRPIDQKEPIPSQSEGQPMPNPQVQEKFPANQSMVDPSKAEVPLPDESMNKLEQQKRKDLDPNPMGPSAGQTSQSQKNEPNPENMDPKDQLLGQLIQEKALQQQQQQKPLANQRRRRSQPPQRVRQLLPDYDDSFPHYGPGTGDVHIFDDTHLYYDDPTRFQRPRTNADLRTQDDRSSNFQPQRNDDVVDITLNV
jgi:hypothetical protein